MVRHSAHARGRRVAFLRWSRRRGECQRRRSHLSAAFHFATFGSPAVSQAWPGSSGVILFLAFLFLLSSCTMCGWAARRCLEATLRVSRALVRTFLPFGAGSGGRFAATHPRSGKLEPIVLPVGSGPSVVPPHSGSLHCGVGLSGCSSSWGFGYAPLCVHCAGPQPPVAALRQLVHGQREAGRSDSSSTSPPPCVGLIPW